jgi:hypothetical protein
MRRDPAFDSIRMAGAEPYQAFLDAGYGEHFCTHGLKYTSYLLQKQIKGSDGKCLFFVDVWVYDRRNEASGPRGISYMPEAQMKGHPTIDVSMHHEPGIGPDAIEAYFSKLYEAMGCTPYDD